MSKNSFLKAKSDKIRSCFLKGGDFVLERQNGDYYEDKKRPELLEEYRLILGPEIAERFVDFVFGSREYHRRDETRARIGFVSIVAQKLGGNLQDREAAVNALVLATEHIADQVANDAIPWDHLEQI